jgi:hypothetical protein
MNLHLTETELAIIASVIFIAIVLFQFFIMIGMPPKDKYRK